MVYENGLCNFEIAIECPCMVLCTRQGGVVSHSVQTLKLPHYVSVSSSLLCSEEIPVHFVSLLTVLVIIMANLNSTVVLLGYSNSLAHLIKEILNVLI